MKALKFSFLPLLFVAFGLMGCDSGSSITGAASEGIDDTPVSLSFSMVDGATFASANAGATTAFGKSATIDLTRVRLLLRTIKFHSDDDDRYADFRTAPTVVELNMNGLSTEIEVADIAQGTYEKVSFRIHKPDENEVLPAGFEDFRVGSSGNERFSMIIEGTFDGTPFVYRSSKSMQQQVDLNPDLIVDDTFAGPLNVAMQVDVSRWFVDRNGNTLDPTADSERIANEIDRSIRESFRAFPDHDNDRRRDEDHRRDRDDDDDSDDDGDDSDDDSDSDSDDGDDDNDSDSDDSDSDSDDGDDDNDSDSDDSDSDSDDGDDNSDSDDGDDDSDSDDDNSDSDDGDDDNDSDSDDDGDDDSDSDSDDGDDDSDSDSDSDSDDGDDDSDSDDGDDDSDSDSDSDDDDSDSDEGDDDNDSDSDDDDDDDNN